MQKVNFIPNPYWVIFENKSLRETQSTHEMSGVMGRVCGTYYVSELKQSMMIVEYIDPFTYRRAIAGVISPSSHYRYLADSDPKQKR